MPKPLTLLTAALLSGVIAPVLAQRPDPANAPRYPIPRDVEELERIHQQEEAERALAPTPALPKPKGPYLAEHLHPAKLPWRCVGAVPWQKVYAEPTTSSRVLGLTQPEIAATGTPVNGFYRVLYYNGIEGFFPTDEVHPFVQPGHPDTTCTFAGLVESGSPRFAFGSSDNHLPTGQTSTAR